MPDLLERLAAALGDRYAIEREVGRGGMAVVFLAEDLKHHRGVAIKVLHPELTATLGAERFLHEIEIIAGLQHPHILPLYDSGEADGLLYYVMPYAEGESLRQRLGREKQLAVDDSVRIAVEVADGLDYAHRKGVVHRDIKPGNILLAEGHATIADFGIARAIEAARAERVTSTGLGVGTPLYASPEQATAQETLDGRTDIYSLGCVLYEMLAGQPPLTGSTPQMIQARRVSETPSPLHGLRDTVPPALDHVIARALARIPADRYATASQFGQALQAALFAVTPAAHADLAMTPGRMAMTPTGVVSEPAGKSRRWWLLTIPVLAVALIVVLWPPSGWLVGGPLEIRTSNIKQVTHDPGLEFQPAISPDGSEVAYVVGPIGNPRIVVQSTIDIGSGGESRPGEGAGGLHWLPAWTPDGASIRFLACTAGSVCDWKQVGSRGGPVRVASVPRTSDRCAWSPDGTRMAFAVGDSIFVASADEAGPQLRGVPASTAAGGLHSLVWSLDGEWIAFVNGNQIWRTSANRAAASIWILAIDGGEPILVTDELHMNVSPQWLPDSRHLLFVSNRDGARGVYVVEVGPEGPSGPPRGVHGATDPHSISISTSGKVLAYSKFSVDKNIWSIPIPASGSVSISDAVPITTGSQIIENHALSPDGEWIAFDADIQGESDIYKRRLEGGESQVVTDLAGDSFVPSWSPDGTEIAFWSARAEGPGSEEIYVVSAEGGASERLTDFPGGDYTPTWSPDGLALAYGSEGPEGEGPYATWTISRDSVGSSWRDPVQLTDFACSWPYWDPDGSRLVCSAGLELVLVSREGAVLSRHDLSTAGLVRSVIPTFSPDGSRIYFRGTHEDGSKGVWWVQADGDGATKVVALDDPSLRGFGRVTVGPEHLYLTISEYESDIWVMDLDW